MLIFYHMKVVDQYWNSDVSESYYLDCIRLCYVLAIDQFLFGCLDCMVCKTSPKFEKYSTAEDNQRRLLELSTTEIYFLLNILSAFEFIGYGLLHRREEVI